MVCGALERMSAGGMRLAVSAFYVYLCMIRRVARGDKAGTLRGCRRSRNMSECVLRRHNAEADSPVFRFRSATDTFFSCGKAFSGVRESLSGDAEKPLPQDERARSAEPEKHRCCARKTNLLYARALHDCLKIPFFASSCPFPRRVTVFSGLHTHYYALSGLFPDNYAKGEKTALKTKNRTKFKVLTSFH